MEILAIIFWIIGLFLLFLVIKLAIDSSETAENIREIRRLLSSQYSNVNLKEKIEVDVDETLDVEDLKDDECPACHSKIQETYLECKSCGLRLKNLEK